MHNRYFYKTGRRASPARRKVWLQRVAGVALGGLAGTAAAYSPEIWEAVASPDGPAMADQGAPDRAAPIPPPAAADSARQIAHMLITHARDLIWRDEVREAERFLAAAEKLEPDSQALAETRRLLEVAKAKIDLAKHAPASGNPLATRP